MKQLPIVLFKAVFLKRLKSKTNLCFYLHHSAQWPQHTRDIYFSALDMPKRT